MDKIRVLVVDDTVLIREGMIALLSYSQDIEVVGQAENGIQALEMVKQTRPDVVLLDLVMPQQDGLTTIPKLLEIAPETHILVVTTFAENEYVFPAIKAGALGYLLKDASREQIVQAIRDVAGGQAFLSPSIALKVMNEINHPKETSYTTDPLTPRELDTLRLIAHGHSNQDIAKILFIHERTIAKYVSSILSKLHLANRTQAALYALREGISEIPKETPE